MRQSSYYIHFIIQKKDKINIIYNGLKDEAVFLSDREKNLLKKQHFIKSDESILLYVGRLDINKGVRELIDAFKIIVTSIPNIRLILVGGGDFNQLLKECNGYWGKIIFTGHIDKETVYRFY